MGRLPAVLLLIASWVLAVVLLVVVARGPENYHRLVVRHVRPDAPEPTPRGFTLLFWRNLFLLVVVAWFAVSRTIDALGPTQDDLVESTGVVVDLVPADELDEGRLEAELRLLVGDEVTVEDASREVPLVEEGDGETVATSTWEVRRLSLWERMSGYSDDEDPPEAAACVVLEKTSYSSVGTPEALVPDDSFSVAVTVGSCADRE